MSLDGLTIRAATVSDRGVLSDMTALGPRRYVSGRGLVAVIDGDAVAAISLTTGAVVVDLDRANPGMVRSLRRRRYQIMRQGGDTGRALNLLRRLAPAVQGAAA